MGFEDDLFSLIQGFHCIDLEHNFSLSSSDCVILEEIVC